MTRDEVLKYLTNLADEYTSALEAIEGSGSKLVDIYEERATAFRAAAEIIRKSGWRPIAEAPERVGLFLGAYGEMGTWCSYGPAQKDFAIRCGYTHYFPEPAPPAREVENDGE